MTLRGEMARQINARHSGGNFALHKRRGYTNDLFPIALRAFNSLRLAAFQHLKPFPCRRSPAERAENQGPFEAPEQAVLLKLNGKTCIAQHRKAKNAVVTYKEKSQPHARSTRDDFLTGVEIQAMAEVAGFRVLHIQLSEGQLIDWFTAKNAHTTFFACEDGLTIQLKNPPIRWPLRAGEIYTVPPRMELTVFSESGAALPFVLLQYGVSLDTAPTSAPERHFSFGRSISPPSKIGPRPRAKEDELHLYRHGLKRMDILVLQPELRAVIQAHGPYECVPWHTHDNIADTFLAMEGYVQVTVKDPNDAVVLAPGEIYSVPAGQPHFVSGADGKECTVMVVQGVGIYNYKAYLEDMRGVVEDMILK